MEDLVKMQEDCDYCCWDIFGESSYRVSGYNIVLLADTGYNFNAVCFSKG